jgi:hypothetical protein
VLGGRQKPPTFFDPAEAIPSKHGLFSSEQHGKPIFKPLFNRLQFLKLMFGRTPAAASPIRETRE